MKLEPKRVCFLIAVLILASIALVGCQPARPTATPTFRPITPPATPTVLWRVSRITPDNFSRELYLLVGDTFVIEVPDNFAHIDVGERDVLQCSPTLSATNPHQAQCQAIGVGTAHIVATVVYPCTGGAVPTCYPPKGIPILTVHVQEEQ